MYEPQGRAAYSYTTGHPRTSRDPDAHTADASDTVGPYASPKCIDTGLGGVGAGG